MSAGMDKDWAQGKEALQGITVRKEQIRRVLEGN